MHQKTTFRTKTPVILRNDVCDSLCRMLLLLIRLEFLLPYLILALRPSCRNKLTSDLKTSLDKRKSN